MDMTRKHFLPFLFLLTALALPAAAQEEYYEEYHDVESEELPPPSSVQGPPAISLNALDLTPPPPPARTQSRTFNSYPVAVLQGLDKMNARVEHIEARVDEAFEFGLLSVRVRSCQKTEPEDTPEAAAYIEIQDPRVKNEILRTLFRGWMFASSPALSALEHPNYDIWVLDCKNEAAKARSASKPSSAPKDVSSRKAPRSKSR